ncbi:uncharacterized protein MONBRDRAFT_28758 [Monosiga brevicollis MX1]|uniref:Uncharacterized protein n=1 Tax=Monosiga brevicollis TaxID=81824 RepID=A9V938_MONBE|nr:uncharacterized protein MONBRDRAFT_28758 [Monosiga brevicollis MX1]EDQ85987.1 predicted protein [Monosiga brevicollis MX1]|eukprot:XP_001749181.1 hypothetical protein [Monosiga brevicollis MX1]
MNLPKLHVSARVSADMNKNCVCVCVCVCVCNDAMQQRISNLHRELAFASRTQKQQGRTTNKLVQLLVQCRERLGSDDEELRDQVDKALRASISGKEVVWPDQEVHEPHSPELVPAAAAPSSLTFGTPDQLHTPRSARSKGRTPMRSVLRSSTKAKLFTPLVQHEPFTAMPAAAVAEEFQDAQQMSFTPPGTYNVGRRAVARLKRGNDEDAISENIRPMPGSLVMDEEDTGEPASKLAKADVLDKSSSCTSSKTPSSSSRGSALSRAGSKRTSLRSSTRGSTRKSYRDMTSAAKRGLRSEKPLGVINGNNNASAADKMPRYMRPTLATRSRSQSNLAQQ